MGTDMLDAKQVKIVIYENGKIWVNVDGKYILRIGHAKLITMDDPVRGFDVVYEETDEKEQET